MKVGLAWDGSGDRPKWHHRAQALRTLYQILQYFLSLFFGRNLD